MEIGVTRGSTSKNAGADKRRQKAGATRGLTHRLGSVPAVGLGSARWTSIASSLVLALLNAWINQRKSNRHGIRARRKKARWFLHSGQFTAETTISL
jgi:hypothetical protein